jgi:regulator of protease activity HflC (stomatin/prohibitin superfamily)
VPHHVVTTLAKDVELIVAAPVLEYSPLLNDDDLKEIIATSTVKGALEAIAKRASLSLSVADSIAATLDIPAVAALLANPNAQIREDTLDAIIENAEEIEDWHEPLALRPSLSLRAIRRIASFVGSSLVSIMVERNELPPKVGDEIQRKVRSRIEVEDVEDVEEAEKAEEEPKRPAPPKYDFAKLHAEGKIDDKFMCELIDQSRRPAVVEALGTLTGRKTETVKSILESRNGMAITALCWKAGLAMRTALRLQRDFAMLKPDQILNAKDGVDYPQSPHEMETHLALFPA